ncbi:hypothetical protein GF324_10960 [bacterium]|nr:hypothetical protein [bacterium]
MQQTLRVLIRTPYRMRGPRIGPGFALLCLLLLFLAGCTTEMQETEEAELTVRPDSLGYYFKVQKHVIELENPGESDMEWVLLNKPDWVVFPVIRGIIPAGESNEIETVCDLSVPNGIYSDSVVFRAETGDLHIPARMEVLFPTPPNGLYFGTTTEGLPIQFRKRYNEIEAFEGSHITNGQRQNEHFPVFGEIRYLSRTLTVQSRHGHDLTGNYDGYTTLTGTWTLPDSTAVTYTATRLENAQ